MRCSTLLPLVLASLYPLVAASSLPSALLFPRQAAADTNSTASMTTTTPAAPANAPTPSGIKIDFMLSNYWNNSQFLAQSNPSLDFFIGGNYYDQSINSTDSTPDIIGVEIRENREFQTMLGMGAGITDATCIVLQDLKAVHPDAYEEILNLAFNDSPEWLARGGAGMNMVRTVIGSADFGFVEYTYSDTVDGTPDVNLTQFNIDKSPKRWLVLQDIKRIQPNLIIMASPWSQPAWMKGHTNGSLHGGSVLEKYEDVFGDYMVRFVKELDEKKGLQVQRISLQNEPLYDGAKYPCTKMEAPQQARIGTLTRKKLDAAGYKNVGILAYDHNWDAEQYPIQVLDAAERNSFVGAAWHCYGGQPEGQRPFNDAYPRKEVWFTECTRITQNFEEPWLNIKKQFYNLITGSINYNSMAMILWNMALQVTEEGFTRPSLPQTCRNCLAPFHVFANATGPLGSAQGANTTALQEVETISKRWMVDADWNLVRRQGSASNNHQQTSTLDVQPVDGSPQTGQAAGGGLISPRPNEQYNAMTVNPAGPPKSTNPAGKLNAGAMNENQVIPPTRSTYYRTSDFTTLAHLGLGIRPASKGEKWGIRVGVTTTEDLLGGPRTTAQLFRRDLGNGSSRWSLILLQQNDHYGYNYGSFEDMTYRIKFRNATAEIILPPGAFTLQWTAPNLK